MNQILSIVLTVILALTGMVGNLSANPAAQPASAEVSITRLEGDLSGMLSITGASQNGPETIEIVTKLLKALSLTFSADTGTGRLEVKANGLPVAHVAVKHREGGWDVVSNLFSKSLLTIDDTTLSSLSAASSAGTPLTSLGSVDSAALAAIPAAFESLAAAFAEKEGEPETGAYTVAGKEYTTKIPVNVTTKEVGILVLTAVRDLLNDETFAPLAAQLGQNFNAESIDSALAELQEKDDADLAETAVAKYLNDAGDSAVEVTMVQNEQQITLVYARSGKKTDISVQALGMLEAAVSIDQEQQTADISVIMTQNDQQMKMLLNAATVEGNLTIDVEISFQDIVLGIRAVTSSEPPVFTAAEDLTPVALEDLMKGGDTLDAFNTELTQGLMTASFSLMTVAPEIMNLFIPSDSQGTAVEESPAEDAVVVEEPEATAAP